MTLFIDELWEEEAAAGRAFDAGSVAGQPELVARYLKHAIAPGTLLAYTVRLTMHGEIKLKRWRAFTAEEVIRWDRGMIWQAEVRMGIVPVRGFDRIVDGQGEMRWKFLGLVPLMTASGPDIARSAIGRLLMESVWLPAVHAGLMEWEGIDETRVAASLAAQGQEGRVVLRIGETGTLREVSMKRWGDPDQSGSFRLADFGAIVEDESAFSGYTIPSRLRVGWYFGTDRFEEGEFFRVTVDSAEFR